MGARRREGTHDEVAAPTPRSRAVSVVRGSSLQHAATGLLQIAVIETVFRNERGEQVQIARRTLVETGKRIAE